MTATDFTSSLFLGHRHPAGSLRPWPALTTGVPAVLGEPPGARRVVATVATAQGAGAGLVARSTLHALTDVFGTLPGPGDVVAIDAAGYPIARCAAAVAAGRGATVCTYPHHRPRVPRVPPGRRLFLVTDGWCAGCVRPAPLPELARFAQERDATLVVDDTLAFGVLGRRGPGEPFGDGAGTPQWTGAGHDGVLWVASLAKAHGAPLAVVTGPAPVVARLATAGGNRAHSSPPSAADVAAATASLDDPAGNRARRARLGANVARLRGGLRGIGLAPVGLPFPLVAVGLPSSAVAHRWRRRLDRRGLRTVVQRPACRPGVVLSVLVRSDHSPAELDRLVDELSLAGLRSAA